MQKLLSIGIPTFNRKIFLENFFDKFLKYSKFSEVSNVDFIVVDGGSDYDVEGLLKKYSKEFFIRLHRNRSSNIDLDILKIIEICETKYLWLMSDDDFIDFEYFSMLFTTLSSLPKSIDHIYLRRISMDEQLRARVQDVFNYTLNHIQEETLSYREVGRQINMDLGFLSSNIFRVERFKSITKTNQFKFIGSNYLIIEVILSVLKLNMSSTYIFQDPIVLQRTGNDSFLSRMGFFKRQNMELVNLHAIFSSFEGGFENDWKRIHKNRIYRVFLNYKSSKPDFRDQLKVYRLYKSFFSGYCFNLALIIVLLTPNLVFVFLKQLYLNNIKNTL